MFVCVHLLRLTDKKVFEVDMQQVCRNVILSKYVNYTSYSVLFHAGCSKPNHSLNFAYSPIIHVKLVYQKYSLYVSRPPISISPYEHILLSYLNMYLFFLSFFYSRSFSLNYLSLPIIIIFFRSTINRALSFHQFGFLQEIVRNVQCFISLPHFRHNYHHNKQLCMN